MGAAGAVVDHRAVGHDPDIALAVGWRRATLGMGPEDGILPGRDVGLDTAAFLLDPGVDLAVADREATQLLECAGGLGIGQLGHEPEGALPDAERVLHPGLETEQLVERQHLGTAGPAAIALPGELHLAREGHDASARPPVGPQDAATADMAMRHRLRCLDRAEQRLPQLPGRLVEPRAHRAFERADVSTLRMELHGERERNGDRLHGEPLRVLVI